MRFFGFLVLIGSANFVWAKCGPNGCGVSRYSFPTYSSEQPTSSDAPSHGGNDAEVNYYPVGKDGKPLTEVLAESEEGANEAVEMAVDKVAEASEEPTAESADGGTEANGEKDEPADLELKGGFAVRVGAKRDVDGKVKDGNRGTFLDVIRIEGDGTIVVKDKDGKELKLEREQNVQVYDQVGTILSKVPNAKRYADAVQNKAKDPKAEAKKKAEANVKQLMAAAATVYNDPRKAMESVGKVATALGDSLGKSKTLVEKEKAVESAEATRDQVRAAALSGAVSNFKQDVLSLRAQAAEIQTKLDEDKTAWFGMSRDDRAKLESQVKVLNTAAERRAASGSNLSDGSVSAQPKLVAANEAFDKAKGDLKVAKSAADKSFAKVSKEATALLASVRKPFISEETKPSATAPVVAAAGSGARSGAISTATFRPVIKTFVGPVTEEVGSSEGGVEVCTGPNCSAAHTRSGSTPEFREAGGVATAGSAGTQATASAVPRLNPQLAGTINRFGISVRPTDTIKVLGTAGFCGACDGELAKFNTAAGSENSFSKASAGSTAVRGGPATILVHANTTRRQGDLGLIADVENATGVRLKTFPLVGEYKLKHGRWSFSASQGL